MEILVGVVVVAAFGLVAYWKHQETRVTRDAWHTSQETVAEVVAKYGDLAEKLQKPWGEEPEQVNPLLDPIAQLDEEWLNAPESLIDFDEDLRALESEEL